VKFDKSASEVPKCAAYLAAYTRKVVRVEHVPRVSDDMADLADELSRKKELAKEHMRQLLKNVEYTEIKEQ